jgi:pimeloyl-ACP methyl ester carboxylesterase
VPLWKSWRYGCTVPGGRYRHRNFRNISEHYVQAGPECGATQAPRDAMKSAQLDPPATVDSLLQATQTVLHHPRRYRGTVLDATSPESGDVTLVQRAIEASERFRAAAGGEVRRRTAVAWIVDTPSFKPSTPHSSFPTLKDELDARESRRRRWRNIASQVGDTDVMKRHFYSTRNLAGRGKVLWGKEWQAEATRIEEERRRRLTLLKQRFPPPWKVYVDWTKSTCRLWKFVLAAQSESQDPRRAICPSCYLSGHPDAPAPPAYVSPRWQRCEVIHQLEGSLSFRVLPVDVLWSSGRPPRAEVLILETWPSRDRQSWGVGRLHQMARQWPGSITAVVETLAGYCESLAEKRSPVDSRRRRGGQGDPARFIDLRPLGGSPLYARLTESDELEAAILSWYTLKQNTSLIGSNWGNVSTSGLDVIMDAVSEDYLTWIRTSRNDFRSRIAVSGYGISIVGREVAIPAVLTRSAVIDLTGIARLNADVLRNQGVKVVTPADLPSSTDEAGDKWDRRQRELLNSMLEACHRLDEQEIPKTKSAIIQATIYRGKPLDPTRRSRLSRITHRPKEGRDLLKRLEQEYGGKFQKGHGNRLVLTRLD